MLRPAQKHLKILAHSPRVSNPPAKSQPRIDLLIHFVSAFQLNRFRKIRHLKLLHKHTPISLLKWAQGPNQLVITMTTLKKKQTARSLDQLSMFIGADATISSSFGDFEIRYAYDWLGRGIFELTRTEDESNDASKSKESDLPKLSRYAVLLRPDIRGVIEAEDVMIEKEGVTWYSESHSRIVAFVPTLSLAGFREVTPAHPLSGFERMDSNTIKGSAPEPKPSATAQNPEPEILKASREVGTMAESARGSMPWPKDRWEADLPIPIPAKSDMGDYLRSQIGKIEALAAQAVSRPKASKTDPYPTIWMSNPQGLNSAIAEGLRDKGYDVRFISEARDSQQAGTISQSQLGQICPDESSKAHPLSSSRDLGSAPAQYSPATDRIETTEDDPSQRKIEMTMGETIRGVLPDI